VEARNVLAEISVHEDERRNALQAIDTILLEAGKYPFSSGHPGDDRMELFPSDAALSDLHDRMADCLQNARLVGVVEEFLDVIQDTYEDLCVYIAGRAEARVEAEKLLKMVKTLYDAHPLMYKVEELEAAIAAHASENEFKNLESEPIDETDQDLVGVADLLHATLADTELVGIPQDEPTVAACRSALNALRTYITARVAARQELQFLAELPMAQSHRRRIRSALQFAKKTGLLSDEQLIYQSQRHLGRGGQLLTKSSTLKRIDLLTRRLVELEKSKKGSLPPVRHKLEDLDELDRKLTRLVPEARRRLSAAIKAKDAEALATAIQQAKALELKLQKLREYRAQEFQRLNAQERIAE